MDPWHLLAGFLTLLLCALVLGALCERIRQSALIGYLVAGGLVGPHGFGVVTSGDEVRLLAELGVALLLFTIGLEVSWKRLRASGRPALIGGVAQVGVTAALGALVAILFGLDGRQAIVVGVAIALSSTSAVLRLLQNRTELDTQHGRHALGVLLVQDLAVVPLVLIVSSLETGGTAGELALSIARGFGIMALMIGGFYVLFVAVIPRVIDATTALRNRELPVLTAFVTGLGAALLAHALGMSPSIGAFVAGLLMAGSPYAVLVRADVSALRTVFMTVFFSSVGMLADPEWVASHLGAVAGAVLLLVAGKAAILWVVLRLLGVHGHHALATGLALAQAGEFALVLLGAGAGLIDRDVFMLLTSATILTLLLTPALVAWATRVARTPQPSSGGDGVAPGDVPHALVVGFGPAGETLAERLAAQGIRVSIVDLNRHAGERARAAGMAATVGDATHPDVLKHAGVDQASLVAVTTPDDRVSSLVARQVRALVGAVPMVIRARYHLHRERLGETGARVVDEETTVGEELGRQALDLLGHSAAESSIADDGGVDPLTAS